MWLLTDGIIKGFEVSENRAFVIGALRFVDIEYFDASKSGLSLGDSPYHIYVSKRKGWFRSVSFEPASAKDMATALEFLMLHIERSAWEGEFEDWAYFWLRKQGKHLPRIV